MSELCAEGGELFTLIFPIMEKDGGPPFPLSFDLVRGLVEKVGFVLEKRVESEAVRGVLHATRGKFYKV